MAENKMRRRISIKDIAKACDVSANTVSNALNDSPLVRPSTKQLVRETAAKMGYIRNASAHNLRSGKSHLIAIIINDVANPYFALSLKQMCEALESNGYLTIIFNTAENSNVELRAIQTALSQNVEGIILSPTADGIENVRYLAGFDTPFILYGRYFAELDTNYVVFDNYNSGKIVAEQLLANGHKNILFLNGSPKISSSQERIHGFRETLNRHGIPVDPNNICEVSLVTSVYYEELHNVLAKHPECTAVVAFYDVLALKVMRCVQDYFPNRSIEIASFDYIAGSYPVNIPLITIEPYVPSYNIATAATERILKLVKNPTLPNEQTVIPTRLHIIK